MGWDALVWDFIRQTNSCIILLGIDCMHMLGLLHISAIRRTHVANPWVMLGSLQPLW